MLTWHFCWTTRCQMRTSVLKYQANEKVTDQKKLKKNSYDIYCTKRIFVDGKKETTKYFRKKTSNLNEHHDSSEENTIQRERERFHIDFKGIRLLARAKWRVIRFQLRLLRQTSWATRAKARRIVLSWEKLCYATKRTTVVIALRLKFRRC